MAADGTLSLQTTSDQKFKHHVSDPSFASALENEVTSTDTFLFDASFNPTGHTGQQSSQHFRSADTRGLDYNCSLTAANNILTAVSEGCSDTGSDHHDH